MNILILGDTAYTGYTFAKELRKEGINVKLISKKTNFLKNDSFCHATNNIYSQLTALGENLDGYDLIHCNYLVNWFSIGVKLSKAKTPVLLHAHGSDTRPENFIQNSILKYVTSKRPVMLYSTPDLLNNLTWFKGEKFYMPNPVASAEDKVLNPNFTDRILIYATLNRVKKTEKLFPLIESLPEYQFDIIASGAVEYYKSKAPKNLHFIQPFNKERIHDNLTDYPLILGGSQDGTIRICELEALASGVPTLFPFAYNNFYTSSLPMMEITKENITALMKKPNLLENQKDWVKTFHSPEVATKQLIAIYKKLIK